MAAVVYDMQEAGESKVKEKLKDLEKEELLTVLNRLLQSSKKRTNCRKDVKEGETLTYRGSCFVVNVLIVYAHPSPSSFNAAILNHVQKRTTGNKSFSYRT